MNRQIRIEGKHVFLNERDIGAFVEKVTVLDAERVQVVLSGVVSVPQVEKLPEAEAEQPKRRSKVVKNGDG